MTNYNLAAIALLLSWAVIASAPDTASHPIRCAECGEGSNSPTPMILPIRHITWRPSMDVRRRQGVFF